MKKGIHPDNYRPVVFQDISNGTSFLTRSTAVTEETITHEGKEYPLVKIHISSASHPFFTGQEKLVDIEGRVDKFKARRSAAAKHRDDAAAKRSSKAKATKKASDASSQEPTEAPSSETSAASSAATAGSSAPANKAGAAEKSNTEPRAEVAKTEAAKDDK